MKKYNRKENKFNEKNQQVQGISSPLLCVVKMGNTSGFFQVDFLVEVQNINNSPWDNETLRCLSELNQLNTHLIDMHSERNVQFFMVVYIFVRTDTLVDHPGNQTPRIRGAFLVRKETGDSLEGHFLNATPEPTDLSCLMPERALFWH